MRDRGKKKIKRKTGRNRYDGVMRGCIYWWRCCGRDGAGCRRSQRSQFDDWWWLAAGNFQVCSAKRLNMLPLKQDGELMDFYSTLCVAEWTQRTAGEWNTESGVSKDPYHVRSSHSIWKSAPLCKDLRTKALICDLNHYSFKVIH